MTAHLIGNERAVAGVERGLAGGATPHAWLFVGPDGVGKATLARWLAQAVNCVRTADAGGGVGARLPEDAAESDDTPRNTDARDPANSPDASPLHSAAEPRSGIEPCGECAQCQRIARGIHSDVITVSIPAPEPNEPLHKDISVDQVREVEGAVALAPFEGRTRVVIIDPADAMSIGAQNAFLKTLEEPPGRAPVGAPPNAMFVLIATEEDRLLPTARSRCRRIEFGLVPAAAIEGGLGERGVDAEQARLLARLAAGRPGWAIEMAGDPSRLEKRRERLEQARTLGSLPMGDLMDLSERLADQFRRDREAVFERLEAWQGWWRDVLMAQSGAEDGVVNVDMLDTLREDGRRHTRGSVIAFVEALRECRRRLSGNVQARIALDALVAAAPRARRASAV